MATPELRHMLRDDDLNHEEQKQVLELAIKFHKNRFYHQPFAGPQGIAVLFDKRVPVPASPSASPSLVVIRWSSISPVPSWAEVSPSPIPHACSTAWPMAWSGARLGRIGSRRWPNTPPIRWSTL